MEICFLGTGATLPSIKRNVSSTALITDEGVLLFDCGEGTQRQMMLYGVSFMKVRWILLSHFHGDHILGLPGLLQSMELMGRKDPLYVYGPKGTVALMENLHSSGLAATSFPVYCRDMNKGDRHTAGKYTLTAVNAKHTVPALAYRLDGPERPGRFYPRKAQALGIPPGPLYGRLQRGLNIRIGDRIITPEMVMGKPRPGVSVAYAVDTRPTRQMAHYFEHVDVLIFDATFASDLLWRARMTGHSTAAEAANVALEAGARRLYLTHISARYEDAAPLLREARSIFRHTFLARDGLRYRIRMR
jgi:ribonuclease Z